VTVVLYFNLLYIINDEQLIKEKHFLGKWWRT